MDNCKTSRKVYIVMHRKRISQGERLEMWMDPNYRWNMIAWLECVRRASIPTWYKKRRKPKISWKWFWNFLFTGDITMRYFFTFNLFFQRQAREEACFFRFIELTTSIIRQSHSEKRQHFCFLKQKNLVNRPEQRSGWCVRPNPRSQANVYTGACILFHFPVPPEPAWLGDLAKTGATSRFSMLFSPHTIFQISFRLHRRQELSPLMALMNCSATRKRAALIVGAY